METQLAKDSINLSTFWDMNRNPTEVIREIHEYYGIRSFEITNGRNDSNEFLKLTKLQKELNLKIVLHNYCLNEAEDFTLNLATKQKKDKMLSIQMIKRNIERTKMLDGKFYAIHAGFMIEMQTFELGKQISPQTIDIEGVQRFLSACVELSEHARKFGITLLVENNVLTKDNFERSGKSNPFMAVEPEETYKLFNILSKNDIGLLLDWGHLKVSAQTMQFSIDDFLNRNAKFIKGYHYSDNDGLSDANLPISTDSYFWKYKLNKVAYHTLEIKNNNNVNPVEQVEMLLGRINARLID